MKPWSVVWTACLAVGCGLGAPPAPTPPPASAPPAYPRSHLGDDALDAAARDLREWTKAERVGDLAAFDRLEVQPPTETVLPYGIGVYQKETRLPLLLTTGPGWRAAKPADREALATRAFRHAEGRLARLERRPPLAPTVTIQTPQGLVLAWINFANEGRRHLHGEDD